MKQIAYSAMAIALMVFGADGLALKGSLDGLFNPLPVEKKIEKLSFFGLDFTVDPEITFCSKANSNSQRLSCQIKKSDKNPFAAHMVFEKKDINGKASLPFIRGARKTEFTKQFPSINQWVIDEIRVGSFKAILQQAQYFHLDNINQPVLIRAYDVVMNNKTSISVTIICDLSHWPEIKKATDAIELSFKAAK